MDTITSSKSISLVSGDHRRTALEKKILQVKEFVQNKEIFEKEGVAFHIGNFGMTLNASVPLLPSLLDITKCSPISTLPP